MEPSSHRKFEAATLWRWLLAIYWVAMLVGTHMPPRFKAGPEELGDKVLHFLAFAGLAWLIAMAWQTSTGILNRRHLRWIWIAVMLYAVLDEVTQPPFDRDASVWDLLADALGSATGLFVFTRTRHWFDRWNS
jgi:VanZ family protein